MFFAGECPSGWRLYEPAIGRTVLGLPLGGELGRTVGVPLDDGEVPAHEHELVEVPEHRHDVDPPAVRTAQAGEHEHETTPTHPGNPRTGNQYPPPTMTFRRTAWWLPDYPTEREPMPPTEPAGIHDHTVDVPRFPSEATGAPVAVTRATAASLPYVALRGCIKE